MYRRGGFSLIEMLTVMAIFAVVLGLGLSQLVRMRNTMVVKSGVTEFLQDVATVRNNARNSVITGRDNDTSILGEVALTDRINSVDYYAVRFANNNYGQAECDMNSGVITCTPYPGLLLDDGGIDLKLTPDPTANNDCNYILFGFSSTKFKFATLRAGGDVLPNNRTECTYTFTDNTNVVITVKADAINAKFEII